MEGMHASVDRWCGWVSLEMTHSERKLILVIAVYIEGNDLEVIFPVI